MLGRVATTTVALLLRRRALLVSSVLLLLWRAAIVSVLRCGRTAVSLLLRSTLRQSRSSSLSQSGRALTGTAAGIHHRTVAVVAVALGRSRRRYDILDRGILTFCCETSIMMVRYSRR